MPPGKLHWKSRVALVVVGQDAVGQVQVGQDPHQGGRDPQQNAAGQVEHNVEGQGALMQAVVDQGLRRGAVGQQRRQCFFC